MNATAHTPSPATLLFVDDEARVVNLLRIIFRDKYRVITATSGTADLIARIARFDRLSGAQAISQLSVLSAGSV